MSCQLHGQARSTYFQCYRCNAYHCSECRECVDVPEGTDVCVKTLGYQCPTCTLFEERREVLDAAISSLAGVLSWDPAPGVYDVLAIALECRATWGPLTPRHAELFREVLDWYRGRR